MLILRLLIIYLTLIMVKHTQFERKKLNQTIKLDALINIEIFNN